MEEFNVFTVPKKKRAGPTHLWSVWADDWREAQAIAEQDPRARDCNLIVESRAAMRERRTARSLDRKPRERIWEGNAIEHDPLFGEDTSWICRGDGKRYGL